MRDLKSYKNFKVRKFKDQYYSPNNKKSTTESQKSFLIARKTSYQHKDAQLSVEAPSIIKEYVSDMFHAG